MTWLLLEHWNEVTRGKMQADIEAAKQVVNRRGQRTEIPSSLTPLVKQPIKLKTPPRAFNRDNRI